MPFVGMWKAPRSMKNRGLPSASIWWQPGPHCRTQACPPAWSLEPGSGFAGGIGWVSSLPVS